MRENAWLENPEREILMSIAVQTLFEKLGGAGAVKLVVEEFYKKVLADAELKGFFANTDMSKQQQQLENFMTMALGGPNQYNGKPMKVAHANLSITEHHFNLVAGHMVETLKGSAKGSAT